MQSLAMRRSLIQNEINEFHLGQNEMRNSSLFFII